MIKSKKAIANVYIPSHLIKIVDEALKTVINASIGFGE